MSGVLSIQHSGFTEDHDPENASPFTGTKDKATQESDSMLGHKIGSAKYGEQGGEPVGETNQSGIYTKKPADPGNTIA
jgi:hypothetical protein